MDVLYKVEKSPLLDKKIKKSIGLRLKLINEAVERIELASGIKYPPYYVEPVLTVVPPSGNMVEGLGVLYARTIPVEFNGRIQIVIEISAPLVLYSTKTCLRDVLAHELLHYVELIRSFSTLDVASQVTSSYIFEERFADSTRAIDPKFVFKDKRYARILAKKFADGINDAKLNEKCKLQWIEKGLPVARIPMGENQAKVGIDSILRSEFDPKVKEIITKISK